MAPANPPNCGNWRHLESRAWRDGHPPARRYAYRRSHPRTDPRFPDREPRSHDRAGPDVLRPRPGHRRSDRPALQAGNVVLCDRFTDSSEAYQGGGRQLGSEIILRMHQTLCGGLQPDLTLLLLPISSAPWPAPAAATTERRFGQGRRPVRDRRHGLLSPRLRQYREIAAREPERVAVFEGTAHRGDPSQIVELVEERLQAAGIVSTPRSRVSDNGH